MSRESMKRAFGIEEDKKSSSNTSLSESERIRKKMLERKIGFDTFDQDLQATNSTLGNVLGNWQDQDYMDKNRFQVSRMNDRLGYMQEYNQLLGNNDPNLQSTLEVYNNAVNNWDAYSQMYGKFKNNDAFQKSRRISEYDKKYAGYSYDDIIKAVDNAETDEEKDYLKHFTNYSSLEDYEKAIRSSNVSGGSGGRGKSKEAEAVDTVNKLMNIDRQDQYKKELNEKYNIYKLDHASEAYSHLKDNDDFEEKSKYDPEFKDKTYRYINDPEYREQVNLYEKNGFATSKQEKAGYDAMTADEIAYYNYLYQQDKNSAKKYLKEIEQQLTKRKTDQAVQQRQELTSDHPYLMSAISVPENVIGGAGATIGNAIDLATGNGYNPYSYYNIGRNTASATREQVAQDIASNSDMTFMGQNVPAFLYQTLMSVGDSSLGAMTFGGMFTPLMGTTAFQNRAKELTEAGASNEQVIAGALGSGVAEALFEKVSLDNLLKAKNVDGIRRIVKETLKQGGIEASEEVATELANFLWDGINRGDRSDFEMKIKDLRSRGYTEAEIADAMLGDELQQLFITGLGGFLSGAGMGSVHTTSQYLSNRESGQSLKKAGVNSEQLMDLSKNSSEGSITADYIKDLQDRGIDTSNMTDAQLGALYNSKMADDYQTLTSNDSNIVDKFMALKDSENLEEIKKSKETRLAEIDEKSKSMPESQQELYKNNYDPQYTVSDYDASYYVAYSYGYRGIGSDNALKRKGVLNESQVAEIYKQGVIDKANDTKEQINSKTEEMSKKIASVGRYDDSIINYGSVKVDGMVNWSDLNPRQRQALSFVQGFSKATGINVTVLNEYQKNGEKAPNGYYDENTNTIYVDAYAGFTSKSLQDSIIPTMSHETTHWMKDKAPAMYGKIREYVLNTLGQTKDINSIIGEEVYRLRHSGHEEYEKMSDSKIEEYAIDEIIARSCEDSLSNSNKARKLLKNLDENERKSFIAKVKETFENLMQWVNDLLSQYKSDSTEAKALREYKHQMQKLSKLWDQTLEEAIKHEQEVNKTVNEVGIQYDEKTDSIAPVQLFSERTWTNSDYVQAREKAIQSIVEAIGCTEEEATRYVDNVNSVARMIADDRIRLDYEPNMDKNATVLKKNSEYRFSVDMSTLCAKRLITTGTFDAIQRAMKNTAFTSEDIVRIREMMNDRGYQVACGICYVESTRREMGTITQGFIDQYIKAQKNGTAIMRTNAEGKEFPLKSKGLIYPEKGYTPTLADLNTTDIDRVKVEHPEVYKGYLAFMNARGQAKPKLLETRAEYKGEILRSFKNKKAVDSRNKAGGLRVQSFSDFEIVHMLDMMQVVMDMSRVGLMSQAYTKVPEFAEIFGNTGIKINLSLIAKGDGLDKNGNLIFDDVEGMPADKAFALREKYSKNVGTILVGKNDEHIRKALADPRIDFVIPFHKSSWKESLYKVLGLTGYEDYTATQNEKPIDPSRHIKNIQPSEYWDYTKTGRENADEYLRRCEEDGRIPKFPQFANEEGYWKLLIDFKMYDNNGVGSEQHAVKPYFNMESANRILHEYDGSHRKLPVAQDVVDDFVKEYKKEHKGVRYQDRVTTDQYEELKSHFGTTTNFTVAGYMLQDGTMLDFSGKHWGDTTSKYRQVDHRDVSEVLPSEDNGFDAMVNMISSGNIRLMPENGGINLAVAPTEAQESVLRRYIQQSLRKEGMVIVDYDKIDGDTVYSETYDKYASPDQILDDIRNYFRGARKSDLAQFRYQMRTIEGESGKDYGVGVYVDTDFSDPSINKLTDMKNFIHNSNGKWFSAFDVNGNEINVRFVEAKKYKNHNKIAKAGNNDLKTKNRKSVAKQESVILVDELLFTANSSEGKKSNHTHGYIDNNMQSDWINLKTYVVDSNNDIYPVDMYVTTTDAGEMVLYDVIPRKKVDRNVKSFTHPLKASISNRKESVNNFYKRYMELAKSPQKNEEILSKAVEKEAHENGYTYEVWHGSRNEFTEFDPSKLGSNTGTEVSKKWFFAGDKETAESYYPLGVMTSLWESSNHNPNYDPEKLKKRGNAGKLYHMYMKAVNPLVVDVTNYDYEAHKAKQDAMLEFIEQAERNGNDAIILLNAMDNQLKTGVRESTVYMFKDPNQVKSADPVVYDNNGNVVPLSKRFDDSSNDIRFQDRNVGYHAGDLGKAEYLSQQGYYRGTGHFGTGTYFVGDEADINKHGYEARPHHAVKFEDYNLYKVRRDKDGYNLHSALKTIDGNFIKTEYVLNKVISNEAFFGSDAYNYLDEKYGDDDAKYSNSAMIEAFTESAKRLGIDLEIDVNDYDGYDDYYLDDLKNEYKEKVDDLTDRLKGLMSDLDFLFNFNTEDIANALTSTYEYAQNADFQSKSDSLATAFMKAMGYEGIDVRGTGLDNTEYGSVIYDVKSDTVLYQDRGVDQADILGKSDQIQKENEALKNDVERLKKRLALEKQITKGNAFNEKQLDAVVRHLKNISTSNLSNDEIKAGIKEVYDYIVRSGDQVEWNVMMGKAYDIADRMLNNSKGQKITNDYFKQVLKDIKTTAVSLNPEQIKEAESVYGKNWKRAFLNRVRFTENGQSLDSRWQELSQRYPDVFDPDVNPNDQVTALAGMIEDLKDGSEMIQKFNDTESKKELATEIYNQYWNVSTIRTTADKYDKEIKKLNFDHRQAIKDLREQYNNNVRSQKLADEIHYGKIINDLRQQRDQREKEAREFGRRRLNEYKDRTEKNRMVKKITDNAMDLNKWLTKNSKEEHIPEIMKAPVSHLLNAIDFSSKQLLGLRGGDQQFQPTKKDISLSKALEEVHSMVTKVNSSMISDDAQTDILDMFVDLPQGFADLVKDLSSKVNDSLRKVGDNQYVLNEMSLEELETLDTIVRVIKSSVKKMNSFFTLANGVKVSQVANESINDLDSLGKLTSTTDFGKGIKGFVAWSNANPYYAFKRYGEGGQKIFRSIQDGWDKFSYHVNNIIEFSEATYTEEEIQAWEKDIKEFDLLMPASDEAKADPNYVDQYKHIRITVPQLMSLYCLSKREQAKTHIFGGGIRVSDFEEDAKVGKNTVSQTDHIQLSDTELARMLAELTPRQIQVADQLQMYMNTVCADLGNEISMKRYGYNQFTEKDYFPIKSDDNNLNVNNAQENANSLFRLLNMSFTKTLTTKANNGIIISDIFDVFAGHASDMAKYNALALPVVDAYKWYNYKEKIKKNGVDSFDTISVKKSMEASLGNEAKKYFVTFMTDINGEANVGRDASGLVSKLFSSAKVASVGLNLRVALLQPTAYLRAYDVIDPKYMAQAFTMKRDYEEAKKYCGMVMWKSLGYYDINVGRGISEKIKHNETKKDKLVEASMKGAEMGDQITWSYLWNACKAQISDTTNLKKGSDEYFKATADLMRDVIYRTQVVDSTMTRSQLMRGKETWEKMITAFLSEPTLSLNLLQDAVYSYNLDARKLMNRGMSKKEAYSKSFNKNGKHMARAFTAYTVTNILASLVEAGFDWLRDTKREEDITWEEFMDIWFGNFMDDMSITQKIPIVKDAISQLKGYSTSSLDMQWLTSGQKAVKEFGKLKDGKGNPYKFASESMKSASYLSGLPLYNGLRDANALADKIFGTSIEDLFNETIGEQYPSTKVNKK